MKRVSKLAAVMMWASARSMAQERQEGEEPVRRILVSIADRKLVLIERGRVVKIYDTAVGAKRSPSPVGSFKVAHRIPHPAWYGPRQVVAPGPANPLGTRWVGITKKGYGIHGTNSPRSIGRNASHGCIRMLNKDVEELFDLVTEGDTVELYGERTPELEQILKPATISGAGGSQ